MRELGARRLQRLQRPGAPQSSADAIVVGGKGSLVLKDGRTGSHTCKLAAPNSSSEVLGATTGCQDELFESRLRLLRDLHESLAQVDDPAVELTLGRHAPTLRT